MLLTQFHPLQRAPFLPAPPVIFQGLYFTAYEGGGTSTDFPIEFNSDGMMEIMPIPLLHYK